MSGQFKESFNMYLLLLFIGAISCQDVIKPTRVPPVAIAVDSEHLFINYSASFEGEIGLTRDVRFRNAYLGTNIPIIDNKVNTSICTDYDSLYVEIDGVESEIFGYQAFRPEDIAASIRDKICLSGKNEVLFSIESLRKETIQFDACLDYVQFKSYYYPDQIFSEIGTMDTGTEYKIIDTEFNVRVKIKNLASTRNFHVFKRDLKNCPEYKLLELYNNQEGSTNTSGSVVLPIVLSLTVLLVIGAIVFDKYKKIRNKKIWTTNTEIDQNPEYGQQEYYYKDQEKRTNIVEDNEEYEGGAYATDHETYVKDSNNIYYK